MNHPSLSQLLAHCSPDGGIAFIDSGMEYSTEVLLEMARGAASWLKRLLPSEGAVVATLLENGPALVTSWFAAAELGATFMPINARLRGPVLQHVLANPAPDLVVVPPDFADIPAGPNVRVVSAPDLLLAAGSASSPPALERIGAGGLIMHTSGTTGRPKAVAWSEKTQGLHASSYAAELVEVQPGFSTYSCLPMYHVTGMGTTIASMLNGATIHISPRFSASRFWPEIQEAKAVMFPYVGSILAILAQGAGPDVGKSRPRYAMGAAAPEEAFIAFTERFDIEILETYGQTETASVWLMNTQAVPGAIGKPCPRALARVGAGDNGEEITAVDGELQLFPTDDEFMMAGYVGAPDATSEKYTADGWYKTGDVVHRDEDGTYWYRGRLTDAIRRRGENVSAYEVERVVSSVGSIRECAVIGVPSPLGEQDVAVFYVSDSASPDIWHTIRDRCIELLPDFMVPRYYMALDELPRNQSQRVLKNELADRWDPQRADDGGGR